MNKYKNLFFLYPNLKKCKLNLLIATVTMLISSILSAPVPYLMGYIIDKAILLNKSYDQLFKIILLIVIIYIARYFISIVYQYYFTKIQQKVVNEIRISMIDKIIDAPLSFINKKEKGYILARIGESSNIGSLFSPTFLGTFIGIFDMITSLIVMMKLNAKLTLMLLVIIPIYFIMARYSSKKMSESTIKVYESSAVLNGEIYEMLNGIEDIKLLNGKDIQINKLKIKLKNMMKNIVKQNMSFIYFVQNLIITNNLATAMVLLCSGILILKGQLTVGMYTSFSVYMSKILSNAQSLGSLEITLKPICISIGRIKEFFEIDSENSSSCIELNEPIYSISFQNVNFKYSENSKLIIQDFNYEIEKGNKILLRGINGSGKTTLIKLITGLYVPLSGKILINGKDLSILSKKSIRNRIGVVSQNIFLFKGTVLDNILYGSIDKTKDDVIELIEKFNLTEYINRFQNGLNTEIIQNEIGLSGGQAQIIAFLRAIIHSKDIIILDEATSNLDLKTRETILNILKEEELCNILIIISHQNEELEFINKTLDLN